MPALTVRTGGSQRTFAPGDDVVIGRDVGADVRVAHPLVSRAHIVLRFDNGRWVAIDNGSLNGMFIDHQRVSTVVIRDGQSINISNPDGPRLTFEVGRHVGAVSRSSSGPRPGRWPGSPELGSRPARRHVGQPASQPDNHHLAQIRPLARPGPADVSNLATSVIRILRGGTLAAPLGSITIGRATNNDIVIADVLASRHHATLVPSREGVEILDARSINGTFVNGARVDEALLREGDVVTIGNVDLVFHNGTLVHRSETEADTRTGGLQVRGISLTIEHGRMLLDNVSFFARPGTLTAVIGPSGAGKSTLAKVIVGTTNPTSGKVSFEGHDIHGEYASLRSRIGMVPQDDVVHRQLTVDQALGYAAELRLPPDTTKQDRRQVTAQVLEELELTPHAQTRVDRLSGGQRKRASVAMELLTGPSLLILDEPTSGLDPALDRQVMTMLRQLANAGRVVVVVTHSLTYVDVCDQVLLLASGGKTAFCGPPREIGRVMGTTDWADIFTKVGADPDGANRRFLEQANPPPVAPTNKPSDLGKPVHTSLWRQFSTIGRRQLRLIVSDRGYFVFLALLPFILGVLSLAVPGTVGFGVPNPMGKTPNEPDQILVLLNIGAIFMGAALTIRDLIGERAIFRREQAVGLSTTAYLLAKICVYCTAAMTQSAVLVALVVYGKGGPAKGDVVVGNANVGLFLDVAGTCVTAAILGLALSALARSNEQLMPLLVVSIMSQLVFSGGMIPVAHRLLLDQLSWFTPARWGFAASASTVDLLKLVPGPRADTDSHWQHTPTAWIVDMGMLVVLFIGYATLVRWKIRLKGR
ncbi:MAG: ATP-binding cassette domain-containing protein [Mycobacteriaceae bacterium]|nr:ATP-binding cassette domain-containing protein [Mycobacteriaceae bacterium]MBV9638786.1 ATP-binding cassette domain-containing protein [Mycobacteriaceae bacterium]